MGLSRDISDIHPPDESQLRYAHWPAASRGPGAGQGLRTHRAQPRRDSDRCGCGTRRLCGSPRGGVLCSPRTRAAAALVRSFSLILARVCARAGRAARPARACTCARVRGGRGPHGERAPEPAPPGHQSLLRPATGAATGVLKFRMAAALGRCGRNIRSSEAHAFRARLRRAGLPPPLEKRLMKLRSTLAWVGSFESLTARRPARPESAAVILSFVASQFFSSPLSLCLSASLSLSLSISLSL